MSEVTEEDDTYGMLPLPSCPVCEDPFKSVLHHLNKNEECKSKVTSEQRKVVLKKQEKIGQPEIKKIERERNLKIHRHSEKMPIEGKKNKERESEQKKKLGIESNQGT